MRPAQETEQFVEELKEGKSNILVAVRVRGLLPAERHVGGRAILRVLDRKVRRCFNEKKNPFSLISRNQNYRNASIPKLNIMK